MNPKTFAALVFSLVFGTSAFLPEVAAQEPMLRPAEYLLSSGVPLDPGDHAIPCVCDWNNDGLKDLVVGYRSADKVALYLNHGTDKEPAFSGFVNIQANGLDIQHPGSGCGAPGPWVFDYDSDGKRDLLVGTGAEGYVYFYKNTNTDAEPILAGGVLLIVGGSTLTVGARATPYVHDWDEDGLNDLMCGDASGNVHFFRNMGTAQSPVYEQDSLVQPAAGSYPGVRSAVRVFDWDGDGLKDLLRSASNNVSWCKNIGMNAVPTLTAPVRLQAPLQGVGLANIDTGYRMRLEVVDWNSDGMVDLLIGNYDGLVFYYEGYRFAVTGITIQSGGEVVFRWDSAEYLIYNVLAGPLLNALSPAASDLPSGGKTTTWSENPTEGIRFYRIQCAD